jgi:hypothetical protein
VHNFSICTHPPGPPPRRRWRLRPTSAGGGLACASLRLACTTPPAAPPRPDPPEPPPHLLTPCLSRPGGATPVPPCTGRPLHRDKGVKGGSRAGWSHVFVVPPP